MATHNKENNQIEELRKMVKFYEAIAPDDPRLRTYRKMLENAKPITIRRAADVLDDEVIEYIRCSLRPQPHECYRNAALLADDIGGVEYVEGALWSPILIPHAFNCIDGQYFDITLEYALYDDPRQYPYVMFGKYDAEERRKVQSATGLYTSIFDFDNEE